MANNDMDRVVPLGQLDDFKVAEGDPDVRGWEVMASDGRKIGEVDELLVDTNAMKVRYLDVDVDGGVMSDGMDRHVLIPIGYARLEQESDRVLVDGLASSDLGALPSYTQGPLTRDFESSVRESFRHRGTSTATTGMTGMSGAGAGMMDTAGLDNTPGAGTAMGMSGATMGTGLSGADTLRDDDRTLGRNVPEGEGMRAAGYDTETPTHSPLRGTGSTMSDSGSSMSGTGSTLSDSGSTMSGTGSTMSDSGSMGGMRADEVRDTGSMRTGTDSDLGVRAGGTLHGGGMTAPTEGSTEHRGMSAGSPSHESMGGGFGSGNAPMSATGGTIGSGGNAPMGAGGQGPVSGMGTPLTPHGDVSHQSSGLAGSDYQHNADEDFYASDAFDDSRFYGARRGGGMNDAPSRGGFSGGLAGDGLDRDRTMQAGGTTGTPGGGAASREEVERLSRDASELLREDHRNRDVGGSGGV